MTRCSVPQCPEHVVALHFGAAHPLAGLMCIEHLLAVVRKPRCSAPACGAPVALPGAATVAGLLCAGHLAQAVAPPAPKLELPEAPPLPERAWRALCRCGEPGVTLTPGGQLCEAHRTPQPVPTRLEDPEAGVREDAIALAAVELGASVVWGAISTRDYGDAVPSVPCRPRRYARPPVRAVRVELEDVRVPASCRTQATAALASGWTIRLGATPDSILLRGQRDPLAFAARWDGGELVTKRRKKGDVQIWQGASFKLAWLSVGGALPTELNATQLGVLLSVSPAVAA